MSDAEHPVESRTAADDELAIFIDASGSYRVLIPNSWQGGKMPEFAYLVVSSLLRLARKDEIEFSKSMGRWARENLDAGRAIRKPPLKN